MTPDLHERVMEVLGEAMDLDPPHRAAFVETAPGLDDEARAELDRLLGLALDARRAMPTQQGLADFSSAVAQPQCIGPYRIIRPLGEGGMGVVFLAMQSEPVKRSVAIKLICPGMDSRPIIARFEAERQALAMMSHPNVAHVYDAGTTDDTHRPYFVMEFVDGVPINEYCESNKLDLRARLELLMQVCDAVQHAHTKGIIHRDLKPTNVLVTVRNGKPIPKVIDFGIAKAIEQPLVADITQMTAHDQLVGTPQYMSPEQAAGGSADVDTRSDVYALGVIAYELLTGVLPFDSQRLRSASFDELRRIIREDEPPRPSTRVQSMSPGDSKSDGTRSLARTLRGELDWITMKALEKDRQRRYDSPAALAADVRRYLEYEPVCAGPPTAMYRARKFVRRHRVAVAAAALIAASLVGGLSATLWQMRQTRIERDRAQRRLADVRSLAGDFLMKVDEALITGGATEARQQLLTTAVQYLDALAQESGDDPQILGDLVRGYRRVGMVQYFMGLPNLGDPAAAERSYRRSLELAQRRAELLPAGDVDAQDDVANCYYHLSAASTGLRQFDESLAQLRESGKIWDSLAQQHPDDKRFIRGRSIVLTSTAANLNRLSRHEEARDAYEKALTLREQLWRGNKDDLSTIADLAAAHDGLAFTYDHLGDDEKSVAHAQQALDFFRQLVHAKPQNKYWKRNISVVLDTLARKAIASSRLDDARSHIDELLAFRQDLAESDPTNLQAQEDLALALRLRGDVLRLAGSFAESIASLQQAIDVRKRLAEANPTDRQQQANYANTLTALAATYQAMNRIDESIDATKQSLAIIESFRAAGQATDLELDNISKTHQRLGDLMFVTHRNDEAMAEYQRAIDVLADLKSAQNPRAKGTLAFAHARMGDVLAATGHKDEALVSMRQALALHESGAVGFESAVPELREKMAALGASDATSQPATAR